MLEGEKLCPIIRVPVSFLELMLDILGSRQESQERYDVSQLRVRLVVVVGQNRDPLEHIVRETDHLVVQHDYVFFLHVIVTDNPEIFDEVVVVFRAVVSSQHVHDVLALRIESVQDLLRVLSVARRKQNQIVMLTHLDQELLQERSLVQGWLDKLKFTGLESPSVKSVCIRVSSRSRNSMRFALLTHRTFVQLQEWNLRRTRLLHGYKLDHFYITFDFLHEFLKSGFILDRP